MALVCAVILVKTVFDKQNVSELGTSFSSVFEDRLLVESYIYELSDHLYRKRIMLDNCGDMQGNDIETKLAAHSSAIRSIIADYEKTRFTESETTYFKDFKDNVSSLGNLEAAFLGLHLAGGETAETKLLIGREFDNASRNLHLLSAIQVSEGKLLSDNSRKIVAGSSLLTHLEMAVVIAIAVMLQMLVAASKPVLPKINRHPSLN